MTVTVADSTSEIYSAHEPTANLIGQTCPDPLSLWHSFAQRSLSHPPLTLSAGGPYLDVRSR